MPSNNSTLKYIPAQLTRLQRDIRVAPNAIMDKVFKAAEGIVPETEAYAKANHRWDNRTERAEKAQHLIVTRGAGSQFPKAPNKFYMIFAHGAVDPRNNEAYGYYLETKIYKGQSRPYGNFREVIRWLSIAGIRKMYGRVRQ